MSYEISKFDFKGELASASFNAKFKEIETYLNNISSEVENLRAENQQLRELLNNKVEYIERDRITLDILKDVNYPNPYETSSYVHPESLGNLPPGWYHIKFFKHVDKNGYCMQEAFSLSVQNDGIQTQWRRNSDALVWNDWIQIADSHNGFRASRYEASVKTRHIEGDCPDQDGTIYLNFYNRKSVVVPIPGTTNQNYDVGAEIKAIKQRLGM